MSTTIERLTTSLDIAQRNADALDRMATKALTAEARVRAAVDAAAWAEKADDLRARLAELED